MANQLGGIPDDIKKTAGIEQMPPEYEGSVIDDDEI